MESKKQQLKNEILLLFVNTNKKESIENFESI